jgi:hypothetical protein
MKTLQLFLEQDHRYPRFRRLRWREIDAALTDVLLRGVHPWSGREAHGLAEAFVQRLNDDAATVPELNAQGYCRVVQPPPGSPYNSSTRFERLLSAVGDTVWFVDGLGYLELTDIAKNQLREGWCNATARDLAERLHPTFQELRRFLKSKNPKMKLSGYDDLCHYDLGKVLCLDDFAGHDRLLIDSGVPEANFRRMSFLKRVTDGQGRLRLVPEIKDFTVVQPGRAPNDLEVVWRATRDRETVRMRPDIGGSLAKRDRARAFARRWRTGSGELCFQCTVATVETMVAADGVRPLFPNLNYHVHTGVTRATGTLKASRLDAYAVGGCCVQGWRADSLKDVLREYGVSMTGNKDQLVSKLAKLVAREYEHHLPELEAHFGRRRFVRIAKSPPKTVQFPVLEEVPYLRHIVVALYVLRHLRGDAILDPTYENDNCTQQQLAHALLCGRVNVSGAFLSAA